jgi:hypothetical protein
MYCEFQDTNKVFNNKKIYKCKNCGLEVCLENPSINMLCFKHSKDLFNEFGAGHNMKINENNKLLKSEKDTAEYIKEQFKQSIAQEFEIDKKLVKRPKEQLCTDEEIQERLSICNKCNYYKDNSCMLCGCVVVREKNYMNKLANKQAKCPDNRWGPIN